MGDIGRVYVFDSADIPASDLQVVHTPQVRTLEEECGVFCDSMLEGCIDEEKRRIKEDQNRGNKKRVDGTLFSLNWFRINPSSSRTLKLCDVKYSTYQGLKNRINHDGEERGHTLTRVVPMIGIAETIDNMLVLGHREGSHMAGKYLSPAGFAIHESRVSSEFFTDTTVKEIEEELGVEIQPECVRYVGLTSGDDSRNSTVVTYARLPCDTGEVERRFRELNEGLIKNGKKVEHKHLLYLPSDLSSITEFLCGQYSGCLNPVSEIDFEDGVCTRGPPEIEGKQYEQIGNGISAMLALMEGRLSYWNYNNLVGEVQDSGVVERVEHCDINDKLAS